MFNTHHPPPSIGMR